MQKTLIKIAAVAAAAAALGVASAAYASSHPQWDASGAYVVNMNYLGSDYAHDVVLAQDAAGDLSGHGGSPAGANAYTWVVTSGTESGSTVDFFASYTATADAVTPQTVMHVVATVAADGSLSGVWSDNYQGGSRSGTLVSVSGVAGKLGALSAEDFSVVSYDTGLGTLKGYSAGFGLTGATFEDAQSVVVKLYSGATLLQTNTATAKVGDEITGSQISSPFDVSGSFGYAADGYWVNVREAQYGQSVPATRVVAIVTLENGKVVTAESTVLAGDPATIYPVVTPPAKPSTKDQCKNGGWKTFASPTFKNQGQCVSSTVRSNR